MLLYNDFCPFSGLSENPIGGRSWFFTSVGLEVFHVKIGVFTIFAVIYFLPSQEQSVQTGLLIVCENLATCERTQFTPLLCLYS